MLQFLFHEDLLFPVDEIHAIQCHTAAHQQRFHRVQRIAFQRTLGIGQQTGHSQHPAFFGLDGETPQHVIPKMFGTTAAAAGVGKAVMDHIVNRIEQKSFGIAATTGEPTLSVGEKQHGGAVGNTIQAAQGQIVQLRRVCSREQLGTERGDRPFAAVLPLNISTLLHQLPQTAAQQFCRQHGNDGIKDGGEKAKGRFGGVESELQKEKTGHQCAGGNQPPEGMGGGRRQQQSGQCQQGKDGQRAAQDHPCQQKQQHGKQTGQPKAVHAVGKGRTVFSQPVHGAPSLLPWTSFFHYTHFCRKGKTAALKFR